jgi:hypothetical protein
LYIK